MYKIFYMFLFVAILSLGFFTSPFVTYASILIKPTINLGLVGYWPFDNSSISGTTAYDKSGQGNNGTITNGPTSAAGRIGQALQFQESNQQYVSLNSYNFSSNTVGSVCGWMYLDPSLYTAVSDNYLFEIANVSNGATYLDITFNSSGNLRVEERLNSGGYQWIKDATVVFPTRSWQHVCLTQSGSGPVVYVNGSLYTMSDVGSGFQNNTAAWMNNIGATAAYIGRWHRSNNDDSWFGGKIDDVRVYNRALTSKEVLTLYNSTLRATIKTPDNKGLIGYWKLDDGAGSYANDASGNGNKGTLVGSPTWVNGKIGKALSFNGSSQYIDLGNSVGTKLSGDFTASAWIKTSSAGSVTISDIFTIRQNNSGANAGGIDLLLYTNTYGGKVIVQADDGGTTGYRVGTRNLRDGQWHHILGVRSGSTINVYVDGMLDNSSDNVTVSGNISSTFEATIGGETVHSSNDFTGLIDDVRIYNRALSSSEITSLYNTTNKTSVTKLHVLQTPIFSPSAGAVSSGTSVSISVPGGADAIYYTTDGTNPNTSAGGSTSLYSGAITVSTAQVIKAIAVKSGYGKGMVASSKYTISAIVAPTSGLIGYWTLDAAHVSGYTNGSTAYDTSGNSKNGTFINAISSVTGKIAEALSFSGSNAVSVADDAIWNFGSGDFTISAWINTTSASTAACIVCKANGLTTSGWHIELKSGKAYVDSTPSGSLKSLTGSITINDGAWHHILLQRSGANEYLYVDNTLDTSRSDLSGSMTNVNLPLTIGAVYFVTIHTYTAAFVGYIDDVHVYNRALNSTEMSNLYHAGW